MQKTNTVTKKPNIIVRFFKQLLDPTQHTSIKSLSMLTAIFISIGLSACLGYAMIADVIIDGVLNMNLFEAGLFVTCLGSFMGLAAIPKVLIDKVHAKREVLQRFGGESEEIEKEETEEQMEA